MEPDGLVRDLAALRSTLRRLQTHNTSVAFWNKERTLKVMMRNDPDLEPADDPEKVMNVELCLVVEDDEDDGLYKALELECDGYSAYHNDVTPVYVLDSFEIELDDEETLRPLARAINAIHKYDMCACGDYLIKDEAESCLFCELTASKDTAFCAICQHDGPASQMSVQPCCRQTLHRACLATWRRKGQGDHVASCPLCLKTSAPVSQPPPIFL